MTKGPLIAALLLASSCGSSPGPAPREPARVENRIEPAPGDSRCVGPAPDCFPHALSLVDIDGHAHGADELAGKVVILTFWATWAKTAQADIPTWTKLFDDGASKGVLVFGVVVEDVGDDELRRFIADHGVSYPVVRLDDAIRKAFGAPDHLPRTFVYDRNGNRQIDQLGTYDPTELAMLLDELRAK